MATDLMGFVKFRSGKVASMLGTSATARTAAELTTGGTGLNQVSGVSIGAAYQGEVAVAASVIVQLDATSTGPSAGSGICYAYFLGPDGKIITIVQGGGGQCSGMFPLSSPVAMKTGVKLVGAYEANTDGPCQASLAVCCNDGTCDVFSVLAVADTKTSMLNKDNASIGEALSGKSIRYAYATYNATKGLNEDGAGVGAFYLESADGQLKHMFPPCKGNGQTAAPWIPGYRTIIEQNDSLSVLGTT